VSGLDQRYEKVWDALARALVGIPEFTSREVAERVGVTLGEARRFWRALGFPRAPEDERLFTREDVEMLRAARDVRDSGGIDPRILLQMTRVTGQALARAAAVDVLPIVDAVGDAMRDESLSNTDAADAVAAAAQSIVTGYEPFLRFAWRRHLFAAISQLAATSGTARLADEREGRDAPAHDVVTVGFADLVGFTAMSQQIGDAELATVVDRLELVAYEHVPEHGGRIVKTIGDEVMFTAPEAGEAAEIALAIAEGCAADSSLPDVRVGLAIGSTLPFEGDLYGPTVNLASRLVHIARPATVLISEELAEQLRDEPAFALRRIPGVRLKGVGKTEVFTLRRAEPAAKPNRRPRERRGRRREGR
jgi:adenylate cyclase